MLALATFILGTSAGFLAGCAWHAHWAMIARQEAPTVSPASKGESNG